MAVFVISGNLEKLVDDVLLSRDVRKVLAEHYHCVHLNADDPMHSRLVKDLALEGRRGVILSDARAEYETFRQDGVITPEALLQRLQANKSVARPVFVNETRTEAPPVFVGGGVVVESYPAPLVPSSVSYYPPISSPTPGYNNSGVGVPYTPSFPSYAPSYSMPAMPVRNC
jgi:hypothetical protein